MVDDGPILRYNRQEFDGLLKELDQSYLFYWSNFISKLSKLFILLVEFL